MRGLILIAVVLLGSCAAQKDFPETFEEAESWVENQFEEIILGE